MTKPLSAILPGTWELVSRRDVTDAGVERPEPTLGADPVALLIYDRVGHFAAQFMKRDRGAAAPARDPGGAAGGVAGGAAGSNNSRAQGGYDAYFGTYTVDDAAGTVTQRLTAALSAENVGMVLTRAMDVTGDRLTVALRTTAADGEALTRTLIFRRVG